MSRRFTLIQAYVRSDVGSRVPRVTLWDDRHVPKETILARLTELTVARYPIPLAVNTPMCVTPKLHVYDFAAPSHPLRVAHLNPQGGITANYAGLNSHPDMGGQLTYVGELAKAQADDGIHAQIAMRRCDYHIATTHVSAFNEPYERLHQGQDGAIASVLRVEAGPPEFLRKEDLWDHIDAWSRGLIYTWAARGDMPHALCAHYADGGLAASLISRYTKIPFVTFTGHSLGAQKCDGLYLSGKGVANFNMPWRLGAERQAMQDCLHIVVSTDSERTDQYTHPLYHDALAACGRDAAKFTVIPPGVSPDVFGRDVVKRGDRDTIAALNRAIEDSIPADRQHLPLIIVAGRLDAKKNHVNVVRAFAEDEVLQQSANLLLLLKGGPQAFSRPSEHFAAHSDELKVAEQIAGLISAHRLSGKVVVPGFENTQQQFAAVCRYLGGNTVAAPDAPMRRGVLVLASDFEPFGLMPLEAAFAGTPVVVTQNGGPSESFQDVHEDGSITEYGVLVNPSVPADIARGLKRLVSDEATWLHFQMQGAQRVADKYIWLRTAQAYNGLLRAV